MQNRLKKLTTITAALALLAIVSAGAYIGLSPQQVSADEVAENEFVNPEGGARVFIGTGGVRFGDAEDLSVYLYDSSNGDVPQKVTVSFAMPSDDEACWDYAQDYAYMLYIFHDRPGVVAPAPYGELVLQHAGNGEYDMYGPASKDAQVRRVIGQDNQPECFANMAGLAVMLHDADGSLIHVWNPALQSGGKTAYMRSDDGNPLFQQCGYWDEKHAPDDDTTLYSKVDGEWVRDDANGTHFVFCPIETGQYQEMTEDGSLLDGFTDWEHPLAMAGYNLVSQQMHIQGR